MKRLYRYLKGLLFPARIEIRNLPSTYTSNKKSKIKAVKKHSIRSQVFQVRSQYDLPLFDGKPLWVDIIWYNQFLVDEDNLCSRLKLIFDSIKQAGFVRDDDPRFLRINSITQRKLIPESGKVWNTNVVLKFRPRFFYHPYTDFWYKLKKKLDKWKIL